jgi:hypothetical protein
LLVCDGAGRDTGGPGVGDIVGTIVEGLQEGEKGADGEDVGVVLWWRISGEVPAGTASIEYHSRSTS